MTKTPGKTVAILWFVAAALAFIAVAIRASKGQEINWAVGTGALFCLVMGITAVVRIRREPPSS